MRRIPIRTLMVLILLSAIGLAALRNASNLWAGMMLLTALGIVGVAVLGAAILSGREQCWWGGFAFFGGGYLALAVGPWLSDTFEPKLATSQLIKEIYGWKFESPYLPKVKVVEIDEVKGVSKERLVTPKKPAYEYFQRVGHSLFALLAGLIGGSVGAWFHVRRDNSRNAHNDQ
jgi:hypothetical protein